LPPRGHAGFGSDLANEALVHEACREFLSRDALDPVRQADCAILALRRARERDYNRLRLHDHQGIHNARRKPIEAGKNQTIEIAESEPLRRFSSQHIKLVTKRQDLRFERSS
jgi:hypothetical protein